MSDANIQHVERAQAAIRSAVYGVIEDVRPRLGRDFSVDVTFVASEASAAGAASIVYTAHNALGELMYPAIQSALNQLKEHYGKKTN